MADNQKTILREDLKIKGNVFEKENIQINGEVNGDVKAENLKLEEKGKINGNIYSSVSELEGTPARLTDFDDSSWDIREDLTKWHSRGVAFAWYRIKVTLPQTVGGRELSGSRMLFETCVDDYGEVWINGECDRERATVQGFNVPQRIVMTPDPKQGDQYTIAILGMNGPIAAPGGAVFVRYATLAFEWREPGY